VSLYVKSDTKEEDKEKKREDREERQAIGSGSNDT
jgi:hypothetical protein